MLAVVDDDDAEFVFGGMGERGGHSTPPITVPLHYDVHGVICFQTPPTENVFQIPRSGAFFQSHAALINLNLLLPHAVSRPSPSIPPRLRPPLRPISRSSAAGPTSCIPPLPLYSPGGNAGDVVDGDEHDGRGCLCDDESTPTPFPYQARTSAAVDCLPAQARSRSFRHQTHHPRCFRRGTSPQATLQSLFVLSDCSVAISLPHWSAPASCPRIPLPESFRNKFSVHSRA